MKKILVFAVLVAAVCVSLAMSRQHTITGSGHQTTTEREIAAFEGVSVATGITVYLRQGDARRVVVRTDERAAQYVVTEVRGGELRVHYTDNVQVRRVRTSVYVTAPVINSLKASSGGDIVIKDGLRGESLELSASSAGDIKGEVHYRAITASASSGGDIVLSGEADRLKVSASSGGDIKMGALRANIVTASASSGGDCQVYAVEQLTASASSGGDVIYGGSPRNITQSHSSGGEVRRR